MPHGDIGSNKPLPPQHVSTRPKSSATLLLVATQIRADQNAVSSGASTTQPPCNLVSPAICWSPDTWSRVQSLSMATVKLITRDTRYRCKLRKLLLLLRRWRPARWLGIDAVRDLLITGGRALARPDVLIPAGYRLRGFVDKSDECSQHVIARGNRWVTQIPGGHSSHVVSLVELPCAPHA